MKDNDEVVENICILFSELVEYGMWKQWTKVDPTSLFSSTY